MSHRKSVTEPPTLDRFMSINDSSIGYLSAFSDSEFERLAALLLSPDADVRDNTLNKMADGTDVRVIPHLIFVAGNDENAILRKFAIQLLADFRDPRIAQFLSTRANESGLSLREMQEIAQQLGFYDREESVDALLALSHLDGHYVLQLWIAESLYSLNRPRLEEFWRVAASTSMDPVVQNLSDKALHQLRYYK